MTTSYEYDPASHAARFGVTCRTCHSGWPCEESSTPDHWPNLIPNGATVTTYDDLDRLVYYGNCTVVLDRDKTPWILFCNEDGDGYAATAPCPDDGIPAALDLEDLPDRGPLLVVFNGDPNRLAGTTAKGDSA
jgi:hypothetical protein